MGKRRRQKHSRHAERQSDIPSGATASPNDDLAAQTNLHRSSTPTPPPGLTPAILDRLNASLQEEPSTIVTNRQQQLLDQLGDYLRQWRIKAGYTRQELAEKLHLDINQLLCLENGIGAPADISAVQLHTLTTLLTNHECDRRLNISIQSYLTYLSCSSSAS